MSFSEYAARHGVDRSTVSRWVKAGVISTVAGRIDPASADLELEANRPIPRGRAAWGTPDASSGANAAAWIATPTVLAGLRQLGPVLFAARLASAPLAPSAVALATAHFTELLESFITAAVTGDAEPLDDGTLPPAGEPDIAGVEFQAIVQAVAGSDPAAAATWREVHEAMQFFTANAVRPAFGDPT